MKLKERGISIRKKISNLAQEKNCNYQDIETSFLLERLLARLVLNRELFPSLIFKGGYVGLRVYNSERYTVDLDAVLAKSELEEALEKTIFVIEKDIGDAVWFQFEKQIDLKAQGLYGGIRQVFRSGIGEIPSNTKRSRIINFDLGIGDPIVPTPQEVNISQIMGEGEICCLVYPTETMIAEKVHTLVALGDANSRSKDIFDLAYLLPQANEKNLKQAVFACFEYRKTSLPKDMLSFLEKIDLSILKRGWASVVLGVKTPISFEDAYQKFL